MFTGIIHDMGIVKKKQEKGGQVRFKFDFKSHGKIRKRPVCTGQSIAVNGVCLTAAQVSPKGFVADVMKQTLESTSLGALEVGSFVNLERSLRYGDEMGGHFVSGHVDARAKLLAVKKSGKNYTIRTALPKDLRPFIAKKGSISVDGISLTIQSIQKRAFDIGIIPHTWKMTNLSKIKVGDFVNLEVDLIARYQHQFTKYLPSRMKKKKKVTVKNLKKKGF